MKRNIPLIAVWMALIVMLSLSLSRCTKVSYPWVTSTVREGRHDFDLDFWKGLTYQTKITIHVKFTEETKYELCCGDQEDWNKGVGIMTTIHPHVGNATIGWRYNPKSGMFEAGYYVHNPDKSTIHMGGNYAIQVWPEEEWWYSIEDRILTWRYEFSNGATYDIPKGYVSSDLRKLGGWWFGGNQPAPKKLTLYWYW